MGIEELLLDRAKHEGKIEGKVEGKVEGRLEGEYTKTVKIAREMIKDGEHIDKIIKYTELSKAEIENIRLNTMSS